MKKSIFVLPLLILSLVACGGSQPKPDPTPDPKPEPIIAVREAAIADLDAAYATYNPDNYTSENWMTIESIHSTAKANILVSESETEIASILAKAKNDMAAVPQISPEPEWPYPADPEDPEVFEVLSKEDAVYDLRDSIFRNPTLSTNANLGLSKMHNVGIDKDEFENEIKYPGLDEYDYVYDLEQLGIDPEDQGNLRDIQLIIDGFKYLEGTKLLKFQSNTTYYLTSGISFIGHKDVYVVGDNTKIVQSTWGTYITVSNCENMHFMGLTFDMNPSPTIAGVVKSYDGTDQNGDHKVTLSIDPEFNLNHGIYSSWSPLSVQNGCGSYMEMEYDELQGRYVPDPERNLMYNTTSSNIAYKGIKGISIDKTRNEMQLVLSNTFPWYSNKDFCFVVPEPGIHVSFAFTMYDNFGFDIKNCNSTYFEHLTCYTCGGMGFHVADGKDLYINKFDFKLNENSKRLMTCTADIIHTASLMGDLWITNSTLECSHDDALNIKASYGRVTNVNKSAREISIEQSTTDSTTIFEKGDVIDIYDYNSMELIDRFNVEDVRNVGKNYTVTVDKRPSNIQTGHIVGNDTKATHLYLHNCLIQNKRNRGILVQCRDSEISNCTFRNVLMGSVQLIGVGDSNAEAIIPQDIKIKNNKFLTCKGVDITITSFGTDGKITTGAINNIEVFNNLFYSPRSLAINFQGAGSSYYHNNFFSYESLICPIMMDLKYAQDIVIKDNVCNLDNNRRLTDIDFVRCNECCTNIVEENNLVTGGLSE